MGVTVPGGTGVVLEDSEFAFNNIAGFDWGWEAGGLKATETRDLVVRNNHAHDNEGPGLWTDIDTVDTLFAGNLVTDNAGPGIFHEISGAATIRDNTVERNGFGKSEWLWGAGILVAASSDVEVYGNAVLDNADGIAGIQQERGDGPFGPRILANVSVYDNTIRMQGGQTGVVEDNGSDFVFADGNIDFRNNIYLDVSGRRYAWDGRALDRGGWLGVGQGEGSVWETS
jgi:parallel beta-helix repeat protein